MVLSIFRQLSSRQVIASSVVVFRTHKTLRRKRRFLLQMTVKEAPRILHSGSPAEISNQNRKPQSSGARSKLFPPNLEASPMGVDAFHLKGVGWSGRVGGDSSLGGSGRRVQGGHDTGAHPSRSCRAGYEAGDKGSGYPGGDGRNDSHQGQKSTTRGQPGFLPLPFDEAVDISLSRQCCPGTGGPRCWLANGHLLFGQLGKDRNGKTARSRGAERKGGRRSDRVGRIGCQVPACCIPFLVWSHTVTQPTRHGREGRERRTQP